jgi:hypothetical protein
MFVCGMPCVISVNDVVVCKVSCEELIAITTHLNTKQCDG